MPKLRSVWALGLVAALVLQACGTSGGSTAPASASPPAPPSTAPSEQPSSGAPDLTGVKLTIWTASDTTQAQKDLFARFGQLTGASVEPVYVPDPFEENLLTKWATGDRPDILVFQPAPLWVGKLDPDKNLVDLSGEAFVKRTQAGLLDVAGYWNGKNYAAITNSPSVEGIWFNKKVFDRLGLTVPTSYAEFIAVCDQIKAQDPSVSPIFAGGGDVWPLHVFAGLLWSDDIKAGLLDKINAGDAKFTDPEIVGHIKQFKDAIDHGCFNKNLATATYADEEKALIDGTAAMVAQGSWLVDAIAATSGVEVVNETIGFFPLADKTPTSAWLAIQIGTYYVPKNSDATRQEAALAFIRYVTGDGYGQYLADAKDLPVLTGYTAPADVPKPVLDANASLNGSAPHNSMVLKASYGNFVTFLSEMVAGTKTPEQVAGSLQTEFEKNAKALGMPGY